MKISQLSLLLLSGALLLSLNTAAQTDAKSVKQPSTPEKTTVGNQTAKDKSKESDIEKSKPAGKEKAKNAGNCIGPCMENC